MATIKTNIKTKAQEVEKKICTSCKKEKRTTEFYASKNSMLFPDGRVPICKECFMEKCLDKDGSINLVNLSKTLRLIDRPLYLNVLESSRQEYIEKNSFLKEAEDSVIDKFGGSILGIYMKNISFGVISEKTYSDSEATNWISTNICDSGASGKLVGTALERYKAILEGSEEATTSKWTPQEKRNKKAVISNCGYDPFADMELSESDSKYCYNLMASYCEDAEVVQDATKLSAVIELVMLYNQIKQINAFINKSMSDSTVPDTTTLSKLTGSKKDMLASISNICKDHNLSSNYAKNSKAGMSTLTAKMMEMEGVYEDSSVNLYDIKTAEAFKQIAAISTENISKQLTLDAGDYSEIIKNQREMILSKDDEILNLKEKLRNTENELIDLKKNSGK